MATPKKAAAKKAGSKKIDPVVHFEMPAEDNKRVSKFYNQVFGWQMQMLGKEMGNYVLATTASKVDKKGRPKKRGVINGGFFMKSDDMPAQYPSVVIAVDNIKRSMNKVTKAGGKVLGDPMEIQGVGMYVSFYDPEGNRVSIMEPIKEMKAVARKK